MREVILMSKKKRKKDYRNRLGGPILYGSAAKALRQSLASPKPLTEMYKIANECELQLMAEVK